MLRASRCFASTGAMATRTARAAAHLGASFRALPAITTSAAHDWPTARDSSLMHGQATTGFVLPARAFSTARVLHEWPNRAPRPPGGADSDNLDFNGTVLVKVGAGKSLVFLDKTIMGKYSGALLETLSESKVYHASLAGALLDKCCLLVTASTKNEPTSREWGTAVELTGAKTLRDCIKALKDKGLLPADALVFIHVQTAPSTVTDALMRADATADEALDVFSARWRETALALRATRAQLVKVPMLCISPDPIDAVAAEARGVTLLCPPTASAGKAVKLGVFSLPAIHADITKGPKDFPLAVDKLTFFFEEQRTALTQEFIAAMIAQLEELLQFGVLISGPNGVGKTALGVQTFLTCFAQAMLAIYIPYAAAWVSAAKEGKGHEFFLERLLLQNADLIAADPILRAALAPALRGGPLDAAIMGSLLSALEKRPGPAVGVIVDEAQAITFAIRDGMNAKADPTERTAAAYLKQWHTWTDATNVFVRMDIASSHGTREMKLPSGEERRLRIIKPWTADVVAAALSNPTSPAAFMSLHRRVGERLAFIAGGIPRALFHGKQLFADGMAKYKDIDAALASTERTLESDMSECCSGWFADMSESEKQRAADNLLPLLRGKVPWNRVKGLYDDGLVARCGFDVTVSPVSPVAGSIIIGTLAEHLRGHRTPLSTIAPGDQRGHELERQTLAALDGAATAVKLGAKGFDGKPAAREVYAHADFSLMFHNIAHDVTAHATRATLYIPHSDQFPCDAITVPASSDASTPTVVWETSTTAPENRKESKLDNMFAPGGIVEQLQKKYPTRPIIVTLCWDGDLLQGDVSPKCERWLQKAAAASASPLAASGATVTIAVVDRAGLQELGVLA